jgi:hypothetical protein
MFKLINNKLTVKYNNKYYYKFVEDYDILTKINNYDNIEETGTGIIITKGDFIIELLYDINTKELLLRDEIDELKLENKKLREDIITLKEDIKYIKQFLKININNSIEKEKIQVDKSEDIYKLGYHYQYTEQNYELMKKYYLMAIDKGHIDAMNYLGHYYQEIEHNYELMKKYYLMAIDKGDTDAMYYLGHYYQEIEKNEELYKKYMDMYNE